jgi:O-antigen/teichoic acid export membrane protein
VDVFWADVWITTVFFYWCLGGALFRTGELWGFELRLWPSPVFFSFIAGLGVDNILNRELVKFPEKRDELMGTAFRLKLIGGVIAFGITVASVFIINPSPLIKFLVIIYSFTFIFQSLNIVSTFFQSRVEAKKNVRAQVLSSSFTSILKIIIMLSGLGVIWIMLAYTSRFFVDCCCIDYILSSS